MVDIVSKRSGPRREDVAARQMIDKNRQTIERIADQISNGGYSANKARQAAPKEPQAAGLIVSDLGGVARRPAELPKPYVRISPNGRVVVVDDNTNLQMHFLGELRRSNGATRFALATKANGFLAPLEPELAEKLAALDGAQMGGARTDAGLATEIRTLLGYA
jgi:hypothetical protein